MKLSGVELRRVVLTHVQPLRTSFGKEDQRDVLLLRAVTPEGEGWGECVALSAPVYSSEYVEAAQHVLKTHLIPRLMAEDDLNSAGVARVLEPVRGHRMAKGAIEMAVLDAELRSRNESFADHLGATKALVDTGVSVGIMDSITQLLDAVEAYLADGYMRIKLKIEPGWDVEPVREVRSRFGDIVLQVDANTAYTIDDAAHLAKLDDYDLLLIEQPLPEEDLRGHAALASKLRTPICLDESIVSAKSAADAIEMGACSIINIKAGRVGGYLEARKIHDVCAAHRVPVWCGGMMETGLGRAANLALAALPNFTLPGDTSASRRYYDPDITPPFELESGQVRVPTGPGLGVSPIPELLERFTTSTEYISA